jgi:flagellar basal body-associated protein FliL
MNKNRSQPIGGVLLYRILCIIAAVMALVIATVTIYTFIAPSLAKGKPVYTIPAQEISEVPEILLTPSGNIFTGMGRVRAVTADKEPQTIIISIAFPYDKEDVPFMEELASKITDFRTQTISFFKTLPTDTLQKMDDEALKAELLRRYNAALQLGQIPVLYITEYSFL